MTQKTDLRGYSVYLEFKKGTSNKFYEIEVKELEDGRGTFVARYGRIGTNGQTKDYGTFHSYMTALRDASIQEEKKLRKGYRKVSALEALASAIQEPEERQNSGTPPVEIEIPAWNSGSSKTDARLTASAKKHLKKLNLVRASRYELTSLQYQEQCKSLLTQYARDFFRVRETKAHGGFIDARVQNLASGFFLELREKTETYYANVDFRAH